jgi:hypothetical protein
VILDPEGALCSRRAGVVSEAWLEKNVRAAVEGRCEDRLRAEGEEQPVKRAGAGGSRTPRREAATVPS